MIMPARAKAAPKEEAAPSDGRRATTGTVPQTASDAVNIGAGQAIAGHAVAKGWKCKSSERNSEMVAASVDFKGQEVELRLPLRSLAPDATAYPDLSEKMDRMVFLAWKLGSNKARISGPRGSIPIVKHRWNSLVFTYQDQTQGENALLETHLKHVQPYLRFPAYYKKSGVKVFDVAEEQFAELVINDEQSGPVMRVIENLTEGLESHPVVTAEMLALIANRFDVVLSEDLQARIKEHRKQGFELLETQAVARQRESGEEAAAAGLEEFDIRTEASEGISDVEEDVNYEFAGESAASSASSSGPTFFVGGPLRRS